jgi:hypothetical protein
MTPTPEKNIHVGNFTAQSGVVYQFSEITGWLDVRGADTKTAFPKLTTVGGALYASGADTRTAFPKLTTVGSWLNASGADTKTAFPKLTTVGGALYASGADTRTAFPKLTTVGGGLYANVADTRSAFSKLKHQNNREALIAALAKQKLVYQDGILAKLVAKKGAVSRVIIVGQNKISYVVERDGKTAHGATLAEARADLLVKLGKRDTTPYRAWTLKTEASLQEMIVAYRTITGACGQGVSQFLAGRSLPAKFTVARAIDETRGQYGAEQFAEFFNGKK